MDSGFIVADPLAKKPKSAAECANAEPKCGDAIRNVSVGHANVLQTRHQLFRSSPPLGPSHNCPVELTWRFPSRV